MLRFLKKILYEYRLNNARKLFRQKWSIGIYEGPSIENLRPSTRVNNPVLTAADVTDVAAELIADPFVLKRGEKWYMFFEVLNVKELKGQIGLATSADGYSWAYEKIVLREPFHLSYPFVFDYKNEIYMVPETGETKTIRLYKADQFPLEWTLIHTILTGKKFKDTTLFRHQNVWWMQTDTSENARHDQLRLYYADELTGPWTEHPFSPLVDGDPLIARPAGRVVVLDNKLIRFTQECYPDYGLGVSAFHITNLTKTDYVEIRISDSTIIRGSGNGWNRSGMHHIDALQINNGGILAFTDGW